MGMVAKSAALAVRAGTHGESAGSEGAKLDSTAAAMTTVVRAAGVVVKAAEGGEGGMKEGRLRFVRARIRI